MNKIPLPRRGSKKQSVEHRGEEGVPKDPANLCADKIWPFYQTSAACFLPEVFPEIYFPFAC